MEKTLLFIADGLPGIEEEIRQLHTSVIAGPNFPIYGGWKFPGIAGLKFPTLIHCAVRNCAR